MKIGKAIFRGVFVIFLLFPINGSASSAVGNMDDIARWVLTYFPKTAGSVVSMEGSDIAIDLREAHGIVEGILLTIYRESSPVYHPVTGIQLGQQEEEAGLLEVRKIGDHLIQGRLVRSGDTVRIGDLARISAARIPLGILPSGETADHFLMNELTSALTETGRFRISPLPSMTTLDEAAQKNIFYLVQVSSFQEGEALVVNLTLLNTLTGKAISDLSTKINPSDETDLVLERLQLKLFEKRKQH